MYKVVAAVPCIVCVACAHRVSVAERSHRQKLSLSLQEQNIGNGDRQWIATPAYTAKGLATMLLARSSTSKLRFARRRYERHLPRLLMAESSGGVALAPIRDVLQNSWVRQLSAENDENLQKSRSRANLPAADANKQKRPVFNGHYVLVEPTGLQEPRLVLYSKDVAQNLLHISEEIVHSADFLNLVSGNIGVGESWATPYALSIMGERLTNNCPYGTGDGYGDGRAISIAEFCDHELQLKGGGTTPFCRGGDGRAVLRSSIREFLASEAMHHLGVPTTRALSLVVSGKDTCQRPWYTDDIVLRIPDLNDTRLAHLPEEQRRQLQTQLRNKKYDPNIMIDEQCAITCRVSSSFMRVGHIDLFSRRVGRGTTRNMLAGLISKPEPVTSTPEWKELEQIVWHACFREFREDAYEPFRESGDISSAAAVLLEKSMDRIASMVAHWIRVGYVQGNFNADNCLVGGNTMDYGPFGFVEEYSPLYAKWTGSGEHFGFMNQPNAGFVNYKVLVESVAPIINADGSPADMQSTVAQYVAKAQVVFKQKFVETLREKMGLQKDQDVGDDLWQTLEPLLRVCRVDWTLFFRQLSYIMKEFPDLSSSDYDGMLSFLEGDEAAQPGSSPFYEPLSLEHRNSFLTWIGDWRTTLRAADADAREVYERMRLTNPKFIPREWMLVDAYTCAARGDEKKLHRLYELLQRPYDEGSPDDIREFYRRPFEEVSLRGGTAFFS